VSATVTVEGTVVVETLAFGRTVAFPAVFAAVRDAGVVVTSGAGALVAVV